MITENNLAQFTGTVNYYKHWLPRIYLTEGAEYLSSNGCGWLIDLIASNQIQPNIKNEPFQVWHFIKEEEHKGLVAVNDGNDNYLLGVPVEYTDCPCSVKLYCNDAGEGQRVIMLASEY